MFLLIFVYTVVAVIVFIVSMINLDMDGYSAAEVVCGGAVVGLLWPPLLLAFGIKTAIEWIRENW